jgi:cellobiose PTS system EIIB component
MRILVVCGAGASSTFVAQRIRRAAAGQGLAVTATACAWPMPAGELADADLVLLGPHLGAHADSVRALADRPGPRIVVLPDDVFGDLDGSRTLAIALAAPAGDPAMPMPTRREKSDR